MGKDRIHSRYYIGPLVEIKTSAGVAGVRNGNRAAALQTGDPVQLPSRAQFLQRMPARQIIVDCCGEAVLGIKGGGPTLGGKVSGILRKGSAGHEVDSIGSIVQRLRPAIAREAREPVHTLDAQRCLQRVISGRSRRRQQIHGAEIGIGSHAIPIRLIEVSQSHKLGSFASHIAQFQ